MSWEEAIYVKSKIQEILAKDNSYSLPPKEMAACSATAGIEKVDLSWQLPSDTVVDNQLLVDVAGVIIVRKKDSAPQSLLDGVVVLDSTDAIGSYTDTDVEAGETYYYRFFPYSTENTVSMSLNNIKISEPRHMIFGFHDDFTDLNPDTRITYPEGVVNENYVPMFTNGDSSISPAPTLTAGSWGPFLTDFLKNKPAMVKSNGELDYWLDPNDYTKKLDGTASDVSNTSYSGLGAFAWLNKFYTKEVYDQDGNGRTVYFSDKKIDDDYYPIGFIDSDNNELEGLWLPMFRMSSGYKILGNVEAPESKYTIETEKAAIENIHSRCRFLGGGILFVLRDINYMLYKTTMSGENGGYGYSSFPSEGGVDCKIGYNKIINNNPAPGFYGEGHIYKTGTGGVAYHRNKTGGKRFHCTPLSPGQYACSLFDPYILYVLEKDNIVYSNNYTFDLSAESFKEAVSKVYIDRGSNNFQWISPSKFMHLGKDIGSMPGIDNLGSSRTGAVIQSNIPYGPGNGNAHNGYTVRNMSFSDSREAQGGSIYIAQKFTNSSTHSITALLLPPASYDPNT